MTPKPWLPALAAACGLLSLTPGCTNPSSVLAGADEFGPEVTAIYSRTSRDYVRTRKPDGTFEIETYALQEGGALGGPRADPTIDKLRFAEMRPIVAKALATQNFVADTDPATTDLLIVAFWGTTIVPDDVNPRDNRESSHLLDESNHQTVEQATGSGPPVAGGGGRQNSAASGVMAEQQQRLREQSAIFGGMERRMDGQVNATSANVLGYTEELYRTRRHDPKLAQLMAEVETNRYYVVLLAYDYQSVVRSQGRQPQLLWEVRISIPERRNDFAKMLPLMTSVAARYFGQNSPGLIHTDPRGTRVDVGVPQSLGVVPAETKH